MSSLRENSLSSSPSITVCVKGNDKSIGNGKCFVSTVVSDNISSSLPIVASWASASMVSAVPEPVFSVLNWIISLISIDASASILFMLSVFI